ncbi:hypothetical protein ACH4S8_39785 [Streptomyces sp. NPDC021080]|uniref:hypothetical protein n=1 Tax=Streptomyces sp. NPDC021080 TaxID=3365110 RepID=UPI0037ACAFDD
MNQRAIREGQPRKLDGFIAPFQQDSRLPPRTRALDDVAVLADLAADARQAASSAAATGPHGNIHTS